MLFLFWTLTNNSDLRCQFKHQLLQQTFLTVLEDRDFGECGEVNADCDLCPQVHGQLLQDFILSYDLFVYVKMLVPTVNTLSKLFTDVMAAQVCLHLKEDKNDPLRQMKLAHTANL